MASISRWTDPAQVPDITRLLHAAYAPLAAAGMRYVASHQGDEVTLARLRNGEAYLGWDRDRTIVGTISLSRPGGHAGCELFARPGVCVFSQFAVHPDRQGEGVGGELLGQAEARAAALGADTIACDTAESAAHLIAFYRRRGYRPAGRADWEATNYRSVLLAKTLAPAPPPDSGT